MKRKPSNQTASTTPSPLKKETCAKPKDWGPLLPFLTCPFTGQLLDDECRVLKDGWTYHSAVKENGFIQSPQTGELLNVALGVPNRALANLLEVYKQTTTPARSEPTPTISNVRICDHNALSLIQTFGFDLKTATVKDLFEAVNAMENGVEGDFGAIRLRADDVWLEPDSVVTLAEANIHTTSDIYLLRKPISKATMQVFVKNPHGRTTTLEVDPEDTVELLKKMYQWKEGVHTDQQRILHAGKQLDDSRTLAECGVPKENTLHMVLRLRGGCVATKHPMSFEPTSMCLLIPQSKPRDWHEVIKRYHGDVDAEPVESQRPVLSKRSIHRCSQLADGEISLEELRGALTAAEYHALIERGNKNFARKRTLTELGSALAFHTDTNSNCTTQICLDADAYNGSRTVFLTKDGPMMPTPKTGYAITHVQAQVHAVSPLVSGQRVTLFLCNRIDLHKDLKQWAQEDLQMYARLVAAWNCGIEPEKQDRVRWNHYLRSVKSTDAAKTEQFARDVVAHFSNVDRDQRNAYLSQAVGHYLDFLHEASLAQELKPDLIADFIWHAHLQRPARFAADCLERFGCYIEHNV